ncbi:uncharacterized protein LOC134192823 [Corticium candelabrum]|uniref:uncharacterized protein LOC134192823 n=1 Tax=Corticium candelabrum TaxID=121492 RepID=UPI002E275298|nr:uncharacterized protein LOC134192823 [Corticium candelabrum]
MSEFLFRAAMLLKYIDLYDTRPVKAVTDILEQSSSKAAKEESDQEFEGLEDQEIPESNTLQLMCDASTQYDLSHIVNPEEHSYCLTSSPIPLADRAFHPPSFLIAADPGSPTASSEGEVSRDIYTGSDYDLFNDTAAADTSVTSVQLDETEKLPPEEEQKYIVFSSCLQTLLRFCPTCGACSNGHFITLNAQPLVKDIPTGNVLAANAILLCGENFAKFSQFADVLKLQFISESTFYQIQDAYLVPVINDFWEKHQKSILQQLKYTPLCLLGNGRCDSPGYSAKYGTYTHTEQETGLILDFQLVQVSEVANSVVMERKGFERSLQKLQTEGLHIKQIATDRHIQIAATMRKKYPNIDHQFDVWHVSKGIAKKLTQKGKSKRCTKLLPWIQSISNHLWWSSQSCDGDSQILTEKWT